MAAFTNPAQNIERFRLGAGMRVADFGAGAGSHTIPAARAVGEEGKVYAIDVQKQLLEKLARAAHDEHELENVEVIWGDVDERGGSKLGNGSVDAVIVANALFQFEKREEAIREISRVLRPKGRVLVIDWSDSHGGLGPAPEQVLTKSDAEALFRSCGFAITDELEAGAHHYGFIARKNGHTT